MILTLLSADALSQSSQSTVGNRIALKLDETGFISFSEAEFAEVRELGIDLLEIPYSSDINRSVWTDFYLLIDFEQRFQTIYELTSDQESILRTVHSDYNAVPEAIRDNIVAIKLLDFPADYDPRFPETMNHLITELSDSLETPLFYQSAFSQPKFPPELFDFVSSRFIVGKNSQSDIQQPVLLFTPSENVNSSLQRLEEILNESLNFSESVIIIPAEWFFSRMQSQVAFPQIISSYLEGNSVTFPMPEEQKEYPKINWPIIFLLVLWASFVIHYKYQPMYKSSLPRYFFNHSFFVHDVMELRIRNAVSGITVLLQHSLSTGFFFYLLAESFISETGLDALSFHFPLIIYPGFESLCLFIIGIIIALFSHVVSILWLYLLNKEMKYLSQVINLYSWPLHVNFIIITLVVYFSQLSSVHNWLIVAVVAYFIVWLFSFKLAAIDGAKYLEKLRPLNLSLTVGLHFLLITAAVVSIFWIPFMFESLEMAFLLP